jgi:DNA-binding response OmpR family regulator
LPQSVVGVGSATSGLRVLVVEDEYLIALRLEDTLKQFGCRPVGPAFTLEGGLSIAKTVIVDAALLDLDLGGKSVLPLVEELKRRGVPIGFVTAYDLEELRSPLIEGLPWVHKPFTDEQIRSLLNSCAEQRAPRLQVQPPEPGASA